MLLLVISGAAVDAVDAIVKVWLVLLLMLLNVGSCIGTCALSGMAVADAVISEALL